MTYNDSSAPEDEPSHDELESAFVNNESLDRLRAYLNRFNPIRVMKMEHMEIRHSAILAWLLEPRETHGLGDKFLKAFLCEAFRGNSRPGLPTALDVAQSDLRDVELRREWHGIDILIHSASRNWVFIIENKFYSSQHKGQLKKYLQKVSEIIKKASSVRGVFLTLLDEQPEESDFAPIGYRAVHALLSHIVKHNASRLSSEVDVFLRHYLELLEEELDVSKERNEMKMLARQLYIDHKKVIDFVIEHGSTTEFSRAVQNLFGGSPEQRHTVKIGEREFMYWALRKSNFSFLPHSWVEALNSVGSKWPGLEKWHAGYPVMCFGWLNPCGDKAAGEFRLTAEIANDELSNSITNCNEVKNKDLKFKKRKNRGQVFMKNKKKIVDIYDTDEIEIAIKNLLAEFGDEFDLVRDQLLKAKNCNVPVGSP